MLTRNKGVGACLLALLFAGALLAQNYAAVARNTGYQDGLEKGRNDARNGASLNLNRHDYYKDADHGYRDSFRNKNGYKQIYRQAFARGYKEGYNEYSGRSRGRAPGLERREVERENRPGIPRPEERREGMRGAPSPALETARDTGHRDGLEKGSNDARERKSYNLNRHDYYKNADHGYTSSFGNKNEYKRIYREAFQRGYSEGYRRR